MDPALAAALREGDGVVSRDALVSRWAFQNACRAGALVRVLPGVYVDAARAGDRPTRLRAALRYAGDDAVLSHTSALALWRARPESPDEPVHVAVPSRTWLRSRGWLVVHHVRCPGPASVRRGLTVVPIEHALVDAWPLLPPAERHGPVIDAVGARRTTPSRVRAVLDTRPRLPGRRELRGLLDRLTAGCRSHLEIWGHDHVFTGPDMPALLRQHPVRLGRRTIYLDAYADAARVAFELDGAAYHGSPAQREADLRRDAELFAQHRITTIRYSHRRLVTEPDAVRREVLAILHDRLPVRRQPSPRSDA